MIEPDYDKALPDHVRLHFQFHHRLPMWTVYRPTTKDYPGKWVSRMFLTYPVIEHTGTFFLADSLEEIRAKIPPGLISLNRSPEDDPVIEELWL